MDRSGTTRTCLREFRLWSRWYDSPFFQWYFRKFERIVINFLVDIPVDSAILDVGCGTGNLLRRLRERSQEFRLSGIDPTPEMVRRAMVKVPDADVREGVGGDIPYPNATFDVVTCIESLHHHRDPRRSISEMLRVLKPGGRLVLIDPDPSGAVGLIFVRLLGRITEPDATFLFPQNTESLVREFGGMVQKTFRIARAYVVISRKNKVGGRP